MNKKIFIIILIALFACLIIFLLMRNPATKGDNSIAFDNSEHSPSANDPDYEYGNEAYCPDLIQFDDKDDSTKIQNNNGV